MDKLLNCHIEFYSRLCQFGEDLAKKFKGPLSGAPEDQLKPTIDRLLAEFGDISKNDLRLKGETALEDRLGRPDFGAIIGNIPIGYIELKAPGKGANPDRYKGHDKKQWERFKNVPNIIYTDGIEWGLYRNGEKINNIIRLDGDPSVDGKDAVSENNAYKLYDLLLNFISWEPIVPKGPRRLAEFIAPICRLVRDEVLDALKANSSAMHDLKREIKQLLFPDADDDRFADAYAQTVVFAILLARIDGADVLDLNEAYDILRVHNSLLSRSLQVLTDPDVHKDIDASLKMAQRIIGAIKPDALETKNGTDPWLYFYEDFLAVYDPKLRKKAGAYYTPVEVVRCQVKLIDCILRDQMGKQMGFIEAGVATLDPAVGTGTYLLGIIENALERIAVEEGPGAIKGGARCLIHNLYGFEWMVGPYAVAQLRLSQAFSQYAVSLPSDGTGIYLTNTLESPHTKPPVSTLFQKPIAQEHERALRIKEAQTILVCLGNPPYGRHEASTEENRASTGGWVRYGDSVGKPILEDFLEPARTAGHGVHLKNLYNLYIYFIRWALWKVFEAKTSTGPGVVSFITASSYLDGNAFAGVREHMRRVCDYLDIIDLGGEGRGSRQDDNIFNIQTPVAIFIAWRLGKVDWDTPAQVRYTHIIGSQDEKLSMLDNVKSFDDLEWMNASNDWQASFRPVENKKFSSWPDIRDIMPWQNSGVQCKRTWPIAPSDEILQNRWKALLASNDRALAMKESGDRRIDLKQTDLFDLNKKLPPIEALAVDEEIEKIVPYAYRSFDRQFLLADNRVISRPRPPLWYAHSEHQIYLISLFSNPLSKGPALMVSALLPDLDFFRGSYGAKAVMPLFRNREATIENLSPSLINTLAHEFNQSISPKEILGYLYGILAHPAYVEWFTEELINREIRVPITRNKNLFYDIVHFGRKLIWLHTYGERFWDKNHPKRQIPKGSTRCLGAVSDNEQTYPDEFRYDDENKKLYVGTGSFGPVSKEIFEFEVSGLKVVQSWLKKRMKHRSGRKSSPLDDIRPKAWTHQFTRELLELLWVLEHTVAGYPEQKRLFKEVLKNELITAEELSPISDDLRNSPSVPKPDKDSDTLDLKFGKK